MYVINALFESWTDILIYIDEVKNEYEIYKIVMDYDVSYLPIERLYKVTIKICN